jgi:ParB family transcriptional regulator, chromosome partitioning protein
VTDPISDRPVDKSRRLGRGLGALISGSVTEPAKEPRADSSDRLREIPLNLITPNPKQPRREFREEELRELEDSLRSTGLLQPVTVRSGPGGTGFELIAGERRVRAARRLGWTSITALVREIDDTQLLTLALVENLQREDLNPIEEAEGYQRLISEFGHSQLQVAESVGKERSTVANVLRLLNLPAEVQTLVRSGALSAGHARALLGLPDAASITTVARRVATDQLTVRDVERLGKEHKTPRAATGLASDRSAAPEIRRLTDRLRRFLQTDVQIVESGTARGEVRLRFYSADDLERLVELITGKLEDGP